MSKDTAIELEPLTEENTTSANVTFKSTAMVASAVKKKRSRNSHDRMSWLKRKSSSKLLCLEQYTYQDTVPIHTLAVDGKLEELKSSIKKYDLTLEETDQKGYTLLHHASAHNQVLVMSYLIDSGINLDEVDKAGNTALHLAAENDHQEACHLLLSNGASDSILNNEVCPPLHVAVSGKNRALEAILDHPVDYNVLGYRSRTPLHVIAEYDNIEGVDIFHKKVISNVAIKNNRFNLCAQDDDGLTAIHLASRKNSYRVLEYMIKKGTEHGYTIEQILGFLDEENSTPLHAAVDSCNTEVVQVLLKHGASPLDSKGDLIPPLHLACSQGRTDMVKKMVEYAGCEIIAHVDQYKRTPLHYCALSIHSSCMIPFLAEKGKGIVHIDAQDAKGRTPLHDAVTSANLAGTKELLSYGADPLMKDGHGLNALNLALNCKRKVIVNALLELPCASELITQTCSKGYSAIHHALNVGHGECIPKMLAVHRFEVQRTQDEEGNSYLHLAARKGNFKALKALLDVPAIHRLLNEPNNLGATPLHSAAEGGHYRCIDLLLNNGAMFHKSFYGETAFMVACKQGFTDCAKLLLQAHSCQISMTDDQGNTALHAAAQSKSPSMVTLALDKGCKLATNFDSLSFFDMIIDSADFDCAMAVVNHDRWQECLDFYSPSHRCPMIGLIEQMPKVAKAVLDRCHTKATDLDKSHPDYWESFEFKYLFMKKTRSDGSKLHHAYASVHPEQDESTVTTVQYKGSTHGQLGTPHEMKEKERKVSRGKETMKVLQKMKLFKRVSLLTHPVVKAFLDSKWKRYGDPIYIFTYIFQLVMVLLLSVFVGTAPNPTQGFGIINETNSNGTEIQYVDLAIGSQVLRALTLFFNLVLLVHLLFNAAIYCLRKGGNGFVFYTPPWIDVVAIIFNLIFLIPNPLQFWPLGAVGLFFSWFSLLLRMEHFSIPGTIVKLFLEVSRTVFLVLLVCSFLLLGFAFSFYMLVGSLNEFFNVGYSFLSVFGFMLGELPYETYITLDVAGNLPSGGLVLAVILFMAVLMSIVVANLLIGLAIGDIERVKVNATIEKIASEIDFFSQLDKSIPKRYLKRLSVLSRKVYPNKNRSLYSVWRDSWKWLEAQIEPEQSDTSNATRTADLASEIKELKLHVLELKETLQQMQESNAQFRKRYQSLSGSSLNSFDFNLQVVDLADR